MSAIRFDAPESLLPSMMSNSADSIESSLQRARRHHELGELEQAEAAYRQVLGRDSRNVIALNGLARIALHVRQHDAAIALLDVAAGIDPRYGETYRNRGYAYAGKFDFLQALKNFEAAVHRDPHDTLAGQALMSARRELALATDEDYATAPAAPWSDNDWVWEEINGGKTLLVLFSGLGIGNQLPTFVFRKFLEPYRHVDKLFIRDLGRQWYLGGIGPHAAGVDQTREYLQEKTAPYERVVFMGCSAGGLAAILYGELLQVDKVLAFAPQTVLTAVKENELNDRRWLEFIAELRRNVGDSPHLDLGRLNPFRADIDLHYAAGDDIDRLHAERITGRQVSYHPHADAPGHLIALHLRDNGQLQAIIEREIPE